MILGLIFLLISICGSLSVYFGLGLYSNWYYFYAIPVGIILDYLALIIVYIIGLFIVSLFFNKKKDIKKPSLFLYKLIRQTVQMINFFARVKIHTRGLELLPDGPYLMVTNHVSMFDPMVAIDKVKKQALICVTKPENENIPICGPFIHKAGFIAVDRENNKNGLKAIIKAISFITEYKTSIYICPEGKRSKTGEMLPFHAGSFKIATKANVPIVVASVKNAELIHKHFPFRITHVYFEIVKVINKEEYENKKTEELAQQAFELIKENMERK